MIGIRVLFWNAQGIHKKRDEFVNLLTDEHIDIACICESHLTCNMSFPNIPNYITIRNDRSTHLGGLLTIIKDNIKFREIDSINLQLIEYCAIIIQGKTPFFLVNAYLPGGSRTPTIKQHYADDLDKIINCNKPFFLLGDLNSKHTSWNCKRNNIAGNILYNKTQARQLTVAFSKDPTYCPVSLYKSSSTLDIVVTNNKINFSRPFASHISTSDHIPVIFEIDGGGSNNHIRDEPRPNYQKTNWYQFRLYLDNKLDQDIPLLNQKQLNQNEINCLLTRITTATKDGLKLHTPTNKTNRDGTYHTDNIKSIIKWRNYFRRRFARHHIDTDRVMYMFYDKWKKREITIARNEHKNNRLLKYSSDRNSLFKAIKNRRLSDIPPLYPESPETCMIITNTKKAEAFSGHFAKMHANTLDKHNLIFSRHVDDTVNTFINNTGPTITHTEITISDVRTVIKSMKTNKSPGPDMIPVIALKNLSVLSLQLYAHALTSAYNMGYFPDLWKSSTAVPVLKAGKNPKDRSSYRPIALISKLSQVFEKIVNNYFMEHLDNTHTLPDNQFGFRKGHSTIHPLLSLFNNIKSGFAQKKSTAVLTFDIEKAFDRTWHNGLIYKMINKNFPSNIIKIVNSFIKQRQFRVRCGDALSNICPVPWGVPQGSVLSPSLYIFYIHDIPLHDNTSLKLYADDSLVHVQDRNIMTITKAIDEASQKIISYYNKWKIKINGNKTALTLFTQRTKKQLPAGPLMIGKTQLTNTKINITVNWTNKIKYLGVTLDKRLTLYEHINDTIRKFDNTVRLLYPFICRSSTLDRNSKLHLIKLYCIPILTYASPIIVNCAKTHLTRLQRKLNKILRMALDIPCDTRTSLVRQLTGIPSLENILAKNTERFSIKNRRSENKIISEL